MVPHRCTPRARRALSGWAHVSYCTFTGQQCNAQRPLSSARPQLSTSLQLRRRWLRRRCGCKPPRVRATCAARARASQSTSAHTSNTRQAKSTQGRLRRSVGGCRPRNNTKHAKHNSSFLKSDLESTRELGRLQGGPFYLHSERPTVGRPRVDPRCGSTQGRLPAVDLDRTLPNLR